jgi:hypothetical protein
MDEELVSAGRAVQMRGEAFKTGEHTARST